MARGTPHADRARVLAWIAANNLGPAFASRHFGIPENRIKQWVFVARRRGDKQRLGEQRHQLPPANHGPAFTILPPLAAVPPPKIQLPPDIEALAQGAVKLALVTMIRSLKDGDVSVADCAKVIAAVTDRLDAFGDIARKNTDSQAAPAPGSPEWEATVLADLAALPPHLLQRASQRASGE